MNKKGGSIILQGLVSFVLSVTMFAFGLPLLRDVIQSSNLGPVETFLAYATPFIIFFLLIWAFIQMLGRGEE